MVRHCLSAAAVVLALAGSCTTVRADEASHRKAAEDMLKSMNIEKQMEAAIDQMLDVQIKANPQIAQVKGVMKQFLTNPLRYSAIKDDPIKIYAPKFTESELKDLPAFYRTPVEKKSV